MDVRAWAQMNPGQQDKYLADLGCLLLGDRIGFRHFRLSPEQVKDSNAVIVQTPGRVYVWAGAALGALVIGFGIWAIFMSKMSVVLSLLVTGSAVVCSMKLGAMLFERAIQAAAKSDPDAFLALWEIGSFVAVVKGEMYSAFTGPNRWQDVVLLAAGWSELIERQPITRGEELAAFFESMRAQAGNT